MAFNTGNDQESISDINVTPLVDVMLVLLVIFMVTAPLMLNGIDLDLPQTKEVNQVNLSSEQIVLSYTKAGEFYLGKDKILQDEIIPLIKKKFKRNNTGDVLFLRADFGLNYGKVAKLMSFLKGAGITNIALVTETEDQK